MNDETRAEDRQFGAEVPLLSGDSFDGRPILHIKPRGLSPTSLGEMWAFRQVLLYLTLRDLQVRYRQTVIGLAWVVFQPVFSALIFTVLFSRISQFKATQVPYPIFCLAGLVLWTFFAGALSTGSSSLLANGNLVTKVYFPRIFIPLAGVLARLVDLFVALFVLLLLMTAYQYPVGWGVLCIFPVLAVALLCASAFAIGFSALNVRYRDVGIALPFLLQVGMYVTPVIYPSSLIPDRFLWVLKINPMAGVIGVFRQALFGEALDFAFLVNSAAISLVCFIGAVAVFWKSEPRFADYL